MPAGIIIRGVHAHGSSVGRYAYGIEPAVPWSTVTDSPVSLYADIPRNGTVMYGTILRNSSTDLRLCYAPLCIMTIGTRPPLNRRIVGVRVTNGTTAGKQQTQRVCTLEGTQSLSISMTSI